METNEKNTEESLLYGFVCLHSRSKQSYNLSFSVELSFVSEGHCLGPYLVKTSLRSLGVNCKDTAEHIPRHYCYQT